MVFKPRQKREKLNVKLEINQCTIDQFKESMILDVILDGNLSWKPHIASIAMKVSKFISMIHKATLCLPTSVLCTLCYSLVYPHLLYCITAWGSTYPFTLKCFVLLQKKVVEIISRSTFNTRTLYLYRGKFLILYRFQIGKVMFLYKIGRLPDALKRLFSFSSGNHRYYTRQCNSFYIPLREQTLDSLHCICTDLNFSIL